MSEPAKTDPMHGKTLKSILEELVERYGWEELASKISINCFANEPSLGSSLKFLRKTPWARNKVEDVYMRSIGLEPPARKVLPSKQSETSPSDPRPSFRKPLESSPRPKPKINVWTGKPFEEKG